MANLPIEIEKLLVRPAAANEVPEREAEPHLFLEVEGRQVAGIEPELHFAMKSVIRARR